MTNLVPKVEKWQKMPIEIEAIEFGQYNAFDICDWADNTYFVPRGFEHHLRYRHEYDQSNGHVLDDAPGFLVIRTLEGPHRADYGDRIIKGVAGEFYPCKPDIFKATYEKVEVPDDESNQ